MAGFPVLGVLRRLRPTRPFGERRTYPPESRLDGAPQWNVTRAVPTFIAVRSTGEAPGFTPAVSPRLRRRPSPWPPGPSRPTQPGVPHQSPPPWRPIGTHRTPARIHRVRAGPTSRGVTTPVSRVYLPVSLTGPGPSGSAGPSRLCRGCSHPHRRLPDQSGRTGGLLRRSPLRTARAAFTASSSSKPRGRLRCGAIPDRGQVPFLRRREDSLP